MLKNQKKVWNPSQPTPFEVKKFADKLKEITALLIGCDREDLESQTFKSKPLDNSWSTFTLNTNGEIHPKQYLSFEEALIAHRAYCKVYDGDLDNFVITANKMTPRLMLQLLGTEAGRQIIHPNIWVNALFADYYEGEVLAKASGFNLETDPSNWIITDVRFPNEAQVIKDRGGILIRIYRNNDLLDSSNPTHASEVALDNWKEWDYVIDNNDSIEQLIEKTKEILKTEKLWK